MVNLRNVMSALGMALVAPGLAACSSGTDSDAEVGPGLGGAALTSGGSGGNSVAMGGSGGMGVGGSGSPSLGGTTAAGGGFPGAGGSSVGGGPASGGIGNLGGNQNVGGMATTTGGQPASGGTTQTGGSTSSGGTVTNSGGAATGGGPSSGGGPSMGGSSGSGGGPVTGGASGVGGGPVTDCSFTVDATTSESIPTVGIVEWSTSLTNVTSAEIQFGSSTDYAHTAPVDLTESNYRTLLLGNKGSATVHYRIVANGGGTECVSEDYTLQTGRTPNNPPEPQSITTPNPGARAGGFKVTSLYQGQQGGQGFILDADGDIVWWHPLSPDCTRARMSYDGKYMWLGSSNVGGFGPGSGARMTRVSMDGLDAQDMSSQFNGMHHDFAVLPDETVVFMHYATSANGCDGISERAPDGSVRAVVASVCQLLGIQRSHMNAIHHDATDDTIVFSELESSTYAKVDRNGDVKWILNGPGATFTNTGEYGWNANHGFHLLGQDRILIFNNASIGQDSLAIELTLSGNSASRVWTYGEGSRINNNVMGDVQRLSNGNTLVTYSTQGLVHEVDADGNLVEELGWPIGGAIGYMMHRESLYGPPPK